MNKYIIMACALLLVWAGFGCHTLPKVSTPGPRLWFDPDSRVGDDFSPPPSLDEDYIAVERDVWIDLIGQTETYLDKAFDSFQKKQLENGARSMRRAAAALKIETGRTRGAERLALYVASSELYELAQSMEQKEVVEESEIRIVFAHAHYALALLHVEKTHEFFAEKKLRYAGYALQACGDNLRRISFWFPAAKPLQPDAQAQVKAVASKLIRGQELAPSVFQDVLDTIDRQLEKTGLVVAAPELVIDP